MRHHLLAPIVDKGNRSFLVESEIEFEDEEGVATINPMGKKTIMMI
jgi:hypothetical protein